MAARNVDLGLFSKGTGFSFYLVAKKTKKMKQKTDTLKSRQRD
jgi:hypothetical protein